MSKPLKSTKPIRMWIDGKCFTIEHYKQSKKLPQTSAIEDVPNDGSSAMSNHNFTINTMDNGKLATAFRLPSYYCEQLRYFHNLERLQNKTNTVITVPKEGNTGYITVTGNNEPDIINARHNIHSIAGQIRDRLSALQFACIPVNTEEVQTNFEKFKKEILSNDRITGMDESIFQKSTKLHLTIAVFALMDDSEEAAAVAALNDCKEKVVKPIIQEFGALKIKVAGINCMQNNLAKVNVLYANAKIDHENENILQKLVNNISNHFYEKGLVWQYQDEVKLHVTLINTKYRKPPVQSTSKQKFRWGPKRQPFDARGIMEKYKDFYFGESMLDSVHLSYIRSKGEDGFHKPLSIITI